MHERSVACRTWKGDCHAGRPQGSFERAGLLLPLKCEPEASRCTGFSNAAFLFVSSSAKAEGPRLSRPGAWPRHFESQPCPERAGWLTLHRVLTANRDPPCPDLRGAQSHRRLKVSFHATVSHTPPPDQGGGAHVARGISVAWPPHPLVIHGRVPPTEAGRRPCPTAHRPFTVHGVFLTSQCRAATRAHGA